MIIGDKRAFRDYLNTMIELHPELFPQDISIGYHLHGLLPISKNDRAAQERLVKMIVARVWVKGLDVVAISLRPNYHVTVGFKNEKSTELSVDSSGCNIVLNRERRAWMPLWVQSMDTKKWLIPCDYWTSYLTYDRVVLPFRHDPRMADMFVLPIQNSSPP